MRNFMHQKVAAPTLHRGIAEARGFTLPEVLIAVSIFAMVSTIAAALYAQSFKETRRATTQNQLYEDARYVMGLIADEAKNGMIDYDEYYSQNVVGATNYGQSYGRYYSAFFNPGDDNKLGFDCNDVTGSMMASFRRMPFAEGRRTLWGRYLIIISKAFAAVEL
ncbi:MAG: hypothetical protein UY05_C0036G0006 [Candidatus Peregrinibacteria bacterium GW2011_GWA2_47_7]|nr:MAG: hypothetical protein UY05_C0036G0006 [Candidatus Peregrinibacteria bacterium GW2011_GWA2_47_7]